MFNFFKRKEKKIIENEELALALEELYYSTLDVDSIYTTELKYMFINVYNENIQNLISNLYNNKVSTILFAVNMFNYFNNTSEDTVKILLFKAIEHIRNNKINPIFINDLTELIKGLQYVRK